MTKVFSRNRILPKIIVGAWLSVTMLGTTACSSIGNIAQTEISVSKDGTVSMHIVESFDKSYYDKEELQQKILTDVASYNREAGNGSISVEKIAVDNGTATVKMTYATATDYAQFNDSVFFVGSAKEAEAAGYDLNTVLSGVDDELETIGMSDILAMEEYKILITDSKEPIVLDSKAEYVSENVSVSKNKKTITFAEETQELAYVMFR